MPVDCKNTELPPEACSEGPETWLDGYSCILICCEFSYSVC